MIVFFTEVEEFDFMFCFFMFLIMVTWCSPKSSGFHTLLFLINVFQCSPKGSGLHTIKFAAIIQKIIIHCLFFF